MTAPLASAVVEVGVDTDRFDRELRRKLAASGIQAGRDMDRAIKSGLDNTGSDIGRRVGDGVGDGLRRNRGRIDREGRRIGSDLGANVGRSFTDSFRLALGFQAAAAALRGALAPLQGLAVGLGFSLIAAQAAAAAAAVLQLGVALAPAAGIMATLPGFLAAGVAGLLTFKVALLGVSDAFSAALEGDAAAFEEALQKLAPSAQAVARELFALKPALDAIRDSVQEAFFSQFVGQLTQTAQLLAGPVSAGMTQVATAGGQVVAAFAQFAREGATINFLSSLFDSTAISIHALGLALGPLLVAFRGLATVTLPFIEQFAIGLASTVGEFARFVDQAVAAGRATQWIENALTVFEQLGFVASQVGGILSSIFQAAGQSAGNALGSIGNLLSTVNQFLASGEGQAALVSIFESLGVVGGQLGQVFVALGTAIGGLAPIIAQVAQALGPALVTAVTAIGQGLAALGPALIPVAQGIATAFANIAPVMAPLGSAIGGVLSALAPLLPVLGQFIALVGTNLVTALNVVSAVLGPVITAFADALAPVFPQLVSAAQELAPVFVRLGTVIGESLGDALNELLPTIVAVLPEIVNGLVPAITDLANAFADMIPVLAPLITQLAAAFLPLLPKMVPLLVALAEAFINIAGVVILLQAPLIKLIALLLTLAANPAVITMFEVLVKALTFAAEAIAFVTGNWLKLISAVASLDLASIGRTITTLGSQIVQFFSSLPLMIMNALTALPGLLLSFVGSVLGRLSLLVFGALAAIVAQFFNLPLEIFTALATLPTMLFSVFTAAWSLVSSAMFAGIGVVLQLFGALPGQALSLLAPVVGFVGQMFAEAFNYAYGIVVGGTGAILSLIASIPGQIIGYVGNFVSAGQQLINGLISGMQNVAGGSLNALGQRIVAVVRSGINSGISAINSFISNVNAAIPGGGGIPHIPYLARGGLFDEATLAVIGEAGPELALPLSGARRSDRMKLVKKSGLLNILASDMGLKHAPLAPAGGGGQLTNNITINTPATDPARIADKVLDEIARGYRG